MRKAQYTFAGNFIYDTYENDRVVATCKDEDTTKKITKLLNHDSLEKYVTKMIRAGRHKELHRGDK